MLEVIREDGETIDHLLRRYNDMLKRLDFYNQVKTGGFYSKKPSKLQNRVSAIYRNSKREKMDYLKRIGKLEDKLYDGRGYGNARQRFSS